MKKILCVLLAAAMLLAAVSCSGGDETTKPFDSLINGFLKNETAAYLSAFDGEYVTAATEVYKQLGRNLKSELKDSITASLDNLEYTNGAKLKISYKIINKTGMTQAEIGQPYLDLHVISYDLPLDKITEAYKTTLSVKIKGKTNTEELEIEIKTLKINGKWVLHPEMFMFMFA